MTDISDLFELHEATLAYVDGPQDGFLRDRVTDEWYRFRCVALGAREWVWALVRVDGPGPTAGFESASWRPDRLLVESRDGSGNTLVEHHPPETR